MKSIYAILLTFVFALSISDAMAGSKNEDVRTYKNELNLSTQQLQQLNTIYANYEAKVKLMAPSSDWSKKVEQEQTLKKELRSQVKTVLTPMQRKEYREIMGIKPVRKVRKADIIK